MAYKVEDIEGIGAARAKTLAAAGIATTADLLEKCGTAKGRKAIADQTAFSERQLLTWANMADLMRISGVAGEFSELLEAAGVDTVKELQHRNAENLATRLTEVNAEKKLTRRVPSSAEVSKWIAEAASLPPMVSH
ncbi:MAG: DUF4332 domain-containing protein [Rhodospirillales bacterium]|nr:DUF4332 domain-containing protein [Rhodospirillales bacterium]